MESKTRLLLVYALGGLLALTVITGVAALLVFERIRIGDAEMRDRYAERSNCLDQIRAGIYLSGTIARDYFVQPDAPAAPALVEKLRELEAATKMFLDRYEASIPAGDRDAVKLRFEVFAYWKLLDLMFDAARSRQAPPRLDVTFQEELTQRRESMLKIAADIAAALDREWKRGEQELSWLYHKFRIALYIELALVFGLGVVVSWLTLSRMVRLERETRQLSAQLVRAQEQERRSIARELHDEIGQALSGLMLEIGRAAALPEAGPVRDRLQAISGSVEHTVEAARRIALSLRPSMLDDLGLVPALEWQAREVGHRTGLNVQVLAEESAGELPDAHRTCIYRVVQEALQNCVRHSGASRVKVALEKAVKTVSLHVEDDGNGFQVGRTRGMGLLGMEERVAQLGGKLRVQSEPGRGTTVIAELPI